jgi:hypothetical protein
MKVKEWTGECQRCFEETSAHIMSMYSTRLICMACKDKETQQDDYQSAVNADNAAIKSGNFNFKGIGEK